MSERMPRNSLRYSSRDRGRLDVVLQRRFWPVWSLAVGERRCKDPVIILAVKRVIAPNEQSTRQGPEASLYPYEMPFRRRHERPFEARAYRFEGSYTRHQT
jgi:hypothetical protein